MRFVMPDGLSLARTTPQFGHESTPEGLRRAHRVAEGVWGRLRVLEGSINFVFDDQPDVLHVITSGDHIDIPPDTPHHVVTSEGCLFVVEFHAAD